MLTYNFIWNCTPKMEMWVKSVKSESAWQHIFWDNLMFSVQLLTCKRVESIQKKWNQRLFQPQFCKVSTSSLVHSNPHPPQVHMWLVD